MFDDCVLDWEEHFSEDVDGLYELTLTEHARSWDRRDPQLIPWGLDWMVPDVFLAAVLSTVDLGRLSGADVVSVLKARHRMVSHFRAGVYEGMAETAHRVDPDTTARCSVPNEYGCEEVGAALGLTRRKADHDLGIALDLTERLPEVLAALGQGMIDDAKARLFSDGTAVLEADTARQVVDDLLENAEEWTTGQLRARLRKAAIEADPEDAQKRFERSVSERRVVAEPNDEGTAALIISQCAPEDVYAATERINRIARQLKTAGEPRSIDQLRADIALGLLNGTFEANTEDTSGRGRGSVNITVDLTTLTRLDDSSAELAGYGPVIAEIARKTTLAQQDGEWTATITHPETGQPLHTTTVRRRPTTTQKRQIRAQYPTCVFKGCRMPAINTDLDHTIDYAKGGPTTPENQAPLCRRHHLSKHRGNWKYHKLTPTLIQWTSPLGHTYHVHIPP